MDYPNGAIDNLFMTEDSEYTRFGEEGSLEDIWYDEDVSFDTPTVNEYPVVFDLEPKKIIATQDGGLVWMPQLIVYINKICKGQHIEPIEVSPLRDSTDYFGQEWVVRDGHHRLAAHHLCNKLVPCRISTF
jgi:hypothetical protein